MPHSAFHLNALRLWFIRFTTAIWTWLPTPNNEPAFTCKLATKLPVALMFFSARGEVDMPRQTSDALRIPHST